MESSKIFTIFAGVNGAGKSTLYAADNSAELGVRLNSDELVREAGADWRSVEAQIAAGKQLLKIQKECFEKGISCNRETNIYDNSGEYLILVAYRINGKLQKTNSSIQWVNDRLAQVVS